MVFYTHLQIANFIVLYQIQGLDNQVKALKKAELPKNCTVPQIKAWLQSLKKAPDEKAVRLLVERIDVKNKTEIHVASTLKSVLCENGCKSQKPLVCTTFTYHTAVCSLVFNFLFN